MKEAKSIAQAIGYHFAADLHILTVLTDVRDEWWLSLLMNSTDATHKRDNNEAPNEEDINTRVREGVREG